MRLRAAIVAIPLAACGDGVPATPEPGPASGTRLVTMWLGYDDGARQLHQREVFDLEQEVPCRPLRWDDGVVRCAPEAAEAVYADAGCTRAVGRVRVPSVPTHYIVRHRLGGVAAPSRLYRAGVEVVDVPRLDVLYELQDGVCRGPFTAGDGFIHHAIGPAVDVATLAVIDETVEAGVDRLTVRRWRSADGLSMPAAVYNVELGTACAPTVDPDGRVRCHPRDTLPTARFADPECTRPVLLAGSGAPTAIVETTDDDGCPRFHRVSGMLAGNFVFFGGGGGCIARPLEGDETIWDLVPVELAELERTVLAERWRRLQQVILTAGGRRFADDRLHDTATGEDCGAAEVDGVVRCLPETIAWTTTGMFRSETCQVPTEVVLLPQRCKPARFAVDREGPPSALRLIGDPTPVGPYQQVFGACSPFTPAPGQVAHHVGPVVDPALFVRAVLFGDR